MKNFSNIVQYIPKFVVLFIALTLATTTTLGSTAQTVDTYINGSVTVKNVTSGSKTYDESVIAANKDVVRFKVQYYNTELANSGKVANNMTIVVDFPNELGKTQVVGATIKGDNTNTIYDSATAHLGSDTSSMTYIPGTAKWQRNVGDRQNIDYQFVDLNDNVITEGKPIVLGDIQPSYEFEGFVYFDAQIKEEYKPPEPVYECTSLTAVVSQTDRMSYTFTTKTKMSDDVSVNKYVYDFGVAGESKVNTDKSQITKVYKDYGTYNSEVEVVFNVGDTQKSDICKTSVTINDQPVEPPVTPPSPELPNTGPASVMAGLFGTGALGYGAYSFRLSREGLRKKILGQDK